MTPQERQEFDELKRIVDTLVRVENVPFVENMKRRLDINGAVHLAINQASLNDIGDVDITSVTNGQVLKWTTTGDDRWINAADNIA